jgi:hypothetical protein
MSYFGPSIIGKKQFEKEQAEEKSGANIFGPSIIGPDPIGANIPGPAVGGVPATAAEKVVNEKGEAFSVKAVRDALADDPIASTIDRMVKAEMFRPEGPRKSALTECLRAEKRREKPRVEVVDMLKGAIKELE